MYICIYAAVLYVVRHKQEDRSLCDSMYPTVLLLSWGLFFTAGGCDKKDSAEKQCRRTQAECLPNSPYIRVHSSVRRAPAECHAPPHSYTRRCNPTNSLFGRFRSPIIITIYLFICFSRDFLPLL